MARRGRRMLCWLGPPLVLLAVLAVRQWRRLWGEVPHRPLHRAPKKTGPAASRAPAEPRASVDPEDSTGLRGRPPASAHRRPPGGDPGGGPGTPLPPVQPRVPEQAGTYPPPQVPEQVERSQEPGRREAAQPGPSTPEPPKPAESPGPTESPKPAESPGPTESPEPAEPAGAEAEVKLGDVRQLTVNAARGRLVRAGFKVRRTSVPAPGGVRPGTVVDQEPEPGTLLPAGSVVTLTVAGAPR